MKNHIVSLEIAKQLKEAGWKKGTIFCWQYNGSTTPLPKYTIEKFNIKVYGISKRDCLAPLATEILEELPYKINKIDYLVIRKCYSIDFYVEYWDYEHEAVIKIKADTLPNALAFMWIYLNKKGLLK